MKYGEKTRIISAFPGMGKTYYHSLHKDTTLDSDSSDYSWIMKNGEKIRNPDFPNNYINHIKENIGKYDFIFVSSHKEVREALKNNCLFFYLIYPSPFRKQEFIQRYTLRDSPESFIDLVKANWEDWIIECDSEEFGCELIRSSSDMYLSNEIRHIIASEYGEVSEFHLTVKE